MLIVDADDDRKQDFRVFELNYIVYHTNRATHEKRHDVRSQFFCSHFFRPKTTLSSLQGHM